MNWNGYHLPENVCGEAWGEATLECGECGRVTLREEQISWWPDGLQVHVSYCAHCGAETMRESRP